MWNHEADRIYVCKSVSVCGGVVVDKTSGNLKNNSYKVVIFEQSVQFVL